MASPSFRCFVIGSDTLLQECTDHLVEAGHDVLGVITDTPRIVEWARGRSLRVVDPGSDLAGTLAAEPFDHLFAITWLRILPEAVLDIPRGAAVNFHDGPLPAYAGLNAPAWALLEGATEYGITWHLMSAGVDEGDVLLRRTFPVAPDETSLSLNMKCFAAARDSFPELVDALARGDARPTPQDPRGRRIFGRHDRPDLGGLLDWTLPAVDLERRVRALDFGPYANPLARAKLLDARGRGWIITSARADEAPADARPGTILDGGAAGVRVATGRGSLTLTGLADLSGRPVEPSAASGPALAAGDRLPILADDEARQLTEAVGRLARSEPAWRRRLSALEPAVLPDLTAAGATPGPAVWSRRPVAVPPGLADAAGGNRTAALLAAWASVVARLGRKAEADLAWLVDPGAPPLFAPWRPLRPLPGPDASFTEAAATAAREIAAVGERGPFLRDLLSRMPDAPPTSGCPLPVGFAPTGLPAAEGVAVALAMDGDTVELAWDPDRLPDATARILAEALETFARHGAADAGRPWSRIPLVDTAAERALARWNDTAAAVADTFVHRGFEARARTHPDRPALRFEGHTLTWGALDRRANALAHSLRARGVGPDTVVGVHVERSPELLVATLGVLKAGGAYLPLDPDFPADRRAFMLADSGASVVVTDGNALAGLDAPGVAVVAIEADAEADDAPDDPGLEPSHLAYVIYTSGSTGRPKGVMVEHGNVANFFTGMDAVIRHDPPGVWMAVTSLSFDISVLELFWTLSRGFEVVIHRDRHRDGDRTSATAGRKAASRARLHERGMRFGLFMWGNDDGPGRDKYRLMLDAGRYFDEHGFDSVWTPERHFHAFGGPFPNPAVTGAALAAVTRRLAIRSGSCVSPLHHPIRIAEEWAVVDNLSDGRVGLAFAAGWQPNDFVLRPESFPDQKRVMVDQIDTVRRLWRGEAVEFTNPLGKAVALTTLPRPVQPELPFWITTAGNPDTYRMAGRMGANVLTHLLGQTLDEVAGKIAAYREARAEAGLDPEAGVVTLMLHTFVGADDDAVRELVREPMKDYLRASMKLVLGFAWTFPAFKRPGGPSSTPDDIDLSSLSDDETEAILDFAFDRYYETSGLFGTPDTCVDMVARCADIGVDEIACLLDFGVDTDAVMAGLPDLKEVRDRANQVFDEGTAPEAAAPLPASALDFAGQMRRLGVTHLQCTPSLARMLLEQPDVRSALAGLEHMMVGGEACPEALARDLRRAVGGRLTNMYGPTETTIWSTTHEVEHDGPVPIGRPIANTSVHVLDPWRQPVPPGIPGDLWIGGRGVVRGYHGRPDLTAERFVTDPFAAPGGDGEGSGETPRMYWTGDLARWRADGVLEFLGRVDHQVKIRGYRIELGEIEAVLERRPEVARATVLLREDVPGDQRLVAYVVPAGPWDGESLRRALGDVLPAYMVPGHFVGLDRLPLTPNGKIDRAALPAPDGGQPRTDPVVEPENELEETLVEAWKEVLGLGEVGTEDNFFDAGGHSLLVVQLHRLLSQRIARPLSLVDLYRFPTIRALAAHLGAEAGGEESADAGAARGARRREMLRRRRGG